MNLQDIKKKNQENRVKKEMKSKAKIDAKKVELQKIYLERLERFMSLVELSYVLKHSPRVIQKK